MNTNSTKDIKSYHDALFNASVTGFSEKISLSAMIALLSGTDYKKFTTDYQKLILNDPNGIKPIDKLIDLAEQYIQTLGIDKIFERDIFAAWDAMRAHGNLNSAKDGDPSIRIVMIIKAFLEKCLPNISPTDKNGTGDFIGALFAEITGENGGREKGVVLTPTFLTDFMTDLENLDYKEDVIFDGACGSGSFLTMAYLKMIDACEKDFKDHKITPEEHEIYIKRISNEAIFGNDISVNMSLLTLTNFILLGINLKNLSYGDFFKIDLGYFQDHMINKGILNPPFEYEPSHFMYHMVDGISSVQCNKHKRFTMICPPQEVNNGKKHGNSYDNWLSKTLNMATLDSIIEIQKNAFQESNISVGTSVFMFDLDRRHNKNDKVLYYDFTDSGYEYFKYSGLVDKYGTFDKKKASALSSISDKNSNVHENTRTWTNFYEIPDSNNFVVTIDPAKIAIQDIEETDLTKTNQEIMMILGEKKALIDSANNKIPANDDIDEYIVKEVSEAQ